MGVDQVADTQAVASRERNIVINLAQFRIDPARIDDGPFALRMESASPVEPIASLQGAPDAAVDILCLLAETGCAIAELSAIDGTTQRHAALERTRDRAFEAVALAGHVADAQWEVTVLLRISDVLDRCGDHDDAVQLQARAMGLMYGPLLAGEG